MKSACVTGDRYFVAMIRLRKKRVVVGEGLDTQRQAYLSRPNFHHATNAINHFWALLKWREVA